MTVSFHIEVSDALGQQLQPLRDRLPEILERGMHEVLAEQAGRYQDEEEIVAVLSSQPAPEQVLRLQPSPAIQSRVRNLLERSHQGTLSIEEAAELERYALLEHMVRRAKANAYQRHSPSLPCPGSSHHS
ncbi:MAG: hypothetical protein HC884_05065 [Chloroflexaceae bacterium]|nr:hypothetical protein [Chloroflexaceae bacterium]